MKTKLNLSAISIAVLAGCMTTLTAVAAAQNQMFTIASGQSQSLDVHGINFGLKSARDQVADAGAKLAELREHYQEQASSKQHDFGSKSYDALCSKLSAGDMTAYAIYQSMLVELRKGGAIGLIERLEKTAHGLVGSLDHLVTAFIATSEQEAATSVTEMVAENMGANPLLPMIKIQTFAGSLIAQMSAAAAFLAEASYIANGKPLLVTDEGSGVAKAGQGTEAIA